MHFSMKDNKYVDYLVIKWQNVRGEDRRDCIKNNID